MRDWLRRRGFVWYRKPALPWGLDLHADLRRWFDLDAFDCVVDVGANVGERCLEFAALCPRAQVFAFEMVPATFERLQHNTRGEPRIRAHGIGLSDADRTAEIVLDANPAHNSLHRPAQAAAGAATAAVTLRRLDDVAGELGIASIDLLKVDAEGHDLQVLQGARRLFEAGRVRAVLVEVDFGHSSLPHGHFIDIARWLDAWSLRPLGLYETTILQRGGVPYLDYANALFVRETGSGPAD